MVQIVLSTKNPQFVLYIFAVLILCLFSAIWCVQFRSLLFGTSPNFSHYGKV